MLKIRTKLAQYQEIFYMVFILAMTGMTSMGLNSEDRIYMIIFAVATMFLLLKMAVTDFTWQEFLVMAVLTVWMGTNFLHNREKTLILTAMGIFGARNVDLNRVLKYAFWEKAVLTVGTLTLTAVGVIENEALWLPKNGEYRDIYCYGYYSPNMAFANIFVVLLLAIIVYGDRLKWYAYVAGTVIMLAAYNVFICRTGLLVWVILCVMVLGYRVSKHFKWEKIYMMLFTALPVVLGALTLILPWLARKNAEFATMINYYLTGRITHINRFWDSAQSILLGNVPAEPFDSIYFHALYNYGWVFFVLYFVAYIVGMWYCNKRGKYYETMALGIMAVYGFMEHLPLSILWNLPLLYLSWVLFRERKVINEQLQ